MATATFGRNSDGPKATGAGGGFGCGGVSGGIGSPGFGNGAGSGLGLGHCGSGGWLSVVRLISNVPLYSGPDKLPNLRSLDNGAYEPRSDNPRKQAGNLIQ